MKNMKEQKQMKLTSKYKSTKYMFLLIALSCAVAGCEKDPVTPEPTPTPTPTRTTQKHNVELVMSDANDYRNIDMDTICKYNADPTVDTIFMVPDHYNMWSTVNTTGLQATVNYLRERKNVNPEKVFGKGELQLKASSVDGYPEIRSFFADTLGYNVTLKYTKSR